MEPRDHDPPSTIRHVPRNSGYSAESCLSTVSPDELCKVAELDNAGAIPHSSPPAVARPPILTPQCCAAGGSKALALTSRTVYQHGPESNASSAYFNLPSPVAELWTGYVCPPHFVDERTKAQRGSVTKGRRKPDPPRSTAEMEVIQTSQKAVP